MIVLVGAPAPTRLFAAHSTPFVLHICPPWGLPGDRVSGRFRGMSLIRRNHIYYLRKRVPTRFRDVESRQQIWLSLDTGDHREATRRAHVAWENLLDGWEALSFGEEAEAKHRFEAAKKLARARRFRYLSAERLAREPLEEIIARVERVPEPTGGKLPLETVALLGGAQPPALSLSEALREYYELTRHDLINKSEDQVRKWRNPRNKAIQNLIAVVGDTELQDLTPEDLLEFRSW